MGRSRGAQAPPARSTASNFARSAPGSTPAPTWALGHEGGALRLHLAQTPLEHALLHLELRDAVAEEPAHAVRALVDGDGVPGASELLGAGEPGGPGADHRDGLPGAYLGGLRSDPARLEGMVDDGELDGLDGDGVVVDPQHAGAFARGGAQRAGELREVVGGMEPVHGLAPLVPVDEVVPVGDEIAERTALMAEGDAAVHAPRTLLAELVGGPGQHHLPPVPQPLLHRAIRLLVALELEEAGDLAHAGPSCGRSPSRPRPPTCPSPGPS